MVTIKLKDREYPIMFDAAVIAKIQDRYGSVDLMGEKILEIKECIWIITEAINEAQDYRRIILREDVSDEEKVTEQIVGMLMNGFDLIQNSDMSQAIIKAFNEGMGGEKNAITGRGAANLSPTRKKGKK